MGHVAPVTAAAKKLQTVKHDCLTLSCNLAVQECNLSICYEPIKFTEYYITGVKLKK